MAVISKTFTNIKCYVKLQQHFSAKFLYCYLNTCQSKYLKQIKSTTNTNISSYLQVPKLQKQKHAFSKLIVPSQKVLAVKNETTHKPAKYQTNYPLISKKNESFIPWRLQVYIQDPRTARFAIPRNTALLPIPCEKRNGSIFMMFQSDFAFPLLHCIVLYHP